MKNILIFAILFLGVAFAEDAKLPDADQALLDKATSSHLEAAEKAYSAYLKAVNDAGVKTLKDLEKVKLDAMKKGNLALANAVDAKEKEVKAGSLGDMIVAENNVDMLGNVDENATIMQVLVGSWELTFPDGQVIDHQIKNDGTVLAANGSYSGKVTIESDVIKFTMKWHDTSRDFTLPKKVTSTMIAKNQFGNLPFNKN